MAESFLPLLPRSPAPARVPPADGVALTVLAANLEGGQRDARGQAEALAASDADVLLLCEHTPGTAVALGAVGLADRWPHQADEMENGYFGTLVASRYPITAAEHRRMAERWAQVVDIDIDGLSVRMVPVHTQAPIFDRDLAVWRATIAANAAVADEVEGPVVLGGDWNATGGHRDLRRALARHDLVDASALLGHRWYPTWPVDSLAIRVPMPPVLTLDHVVVRRTTEVVALDRVALPGTDHRALRIELRLPRP